MNAAYKKRPLGILSLFAFFLVITLPLSNLSGQSNAERFQLATEAYANKDYEGAIDQLEHILATGEYAFEVYYNLGNAYFKSDQIAPAILNYERAAKINPTEADLQYNLAIAQSRTVDQIDMIPVPEFVSGYKSFVNNRSSDQWATLSLITFFLMLAALGTFLLINNRLFKQIALSAVAICALFTITTFFFAWQQQSWLNSNREGVVFTPSINVSSTPDNAGETLFVLHEGTKVKIIERFRDFIRIEIGDGKSGWIGKESVREI